jgi:hypothetical protein
MSEQTPPRSRKDIEAHIIAKTWKDETYKQELLRNSKSVVEQEFGVQLPDEMSVQVLEENTTTLYFVLPMRLNLSGAELSEQELEAVAGGFIPVGEIYNAGKDFGDTIYDAFH